jgi:hypothetical protein
LGDRARPKEYGSLVVRMVSPKYGG